jgi:hypothetical protein
MTADDIAWHLQWRPASGHPGGWRVCRNDYRIGHDPYLQQHSDRRGRVILYRSYDSALRKAAELNAQEEG